RGALGGGGGARRAAPRGGVAAGRRPRLYCIPSIWKRLLSARPARFDTSSLRELDTGTSAVPLELLEELKAVFPGTTTRIYYGSTECGAAAAPAPAGAARKARGGRAPPPRGDLRPPGP